LESVSTKNEQLEKDPDDMQNLTPNVVLLVKNAIVAKGDKFYFKA